MSAGPVRWFKQCMAFRVVPLESTAPITAARMRIIKRSGRDSFKENVPLSFTPGCCPQGKASMAALPKMGMHILARRRSFRACWFPPDAKPIGQHSTSHSGSEVRVSTSHGSDAFSPELSAKALRKRLACYAKPDAGRAVRQIVVTTGLLATSMALLFWGLAQGFWPALLCALPAAFFLVRLFIIQHDCGHGSYFRSPRLNNAVGRAIGVATTIPYSAWRRDHAAHHAGCGNLDRRGIGDVRTLTVAEYRSRSSWRRLAYRLYRHPLVLFVLGPLYLLLVRYRVPMVSPFADQRNWISIVGTDAAVAGLATGLAVLIGPLAFMAGWGTMQLVAMIVGVWFFYVQHQFKDTYWQLGTKWEFHTAGMHGSSFYDLPHWLDWLTGSIGLHHIHHLASRIPNYRLRRCLKENSELHSVNRVTLWESFKTVRLTLWDENTQKLVSFRQAVCAR